MEKTNAIRLLTIANIVFNVHEYDENETDGCKVASLLSLSEDEVFKTLVTVSNTNEHFVFVIPVNCKLDLKKAAKSVNMKYVEMIKQKDLYPLTGYIHGGCSPVGMKKKFKTVINDTALLFERIYVSAGKVGMNLDINPLELANYVEANFIDIVV